MSTNVYQSILNQSILKPTTEEIIEGYEKQIKKKQEEIKLIENRIQKLKSTKQY